MNSDKPNTNPKNSPNPNSKNQKKKARRQKMILQLQQGGQQLKQQLKDRNMLHPSKYLQRSNFDKALNLVPDWMARSQNQQYIQDEVNRVIADKTAKQKVQQYSGYNYENLTPIEKAEIKALLYSNDFSTIITGIMPHILKYGPSVLEWVQNQLVKRKFNLSEVLLDCNTLESYFEPKLKRSPAAFSSQSCSPNYFAYQFTITTGASGSALAGITNLASYFLMAHPAVVWANYNPDTGTTGAAWTQAVAPIIAPNADMIEFRTAGLKVTIRSIVSQLNAQGTFATSWFSHLDDTNITSAETPQLPTWTDVINGKNAAQQNLKDFKPMITNPLISENVPQNGFVGPTASYNNFLSNYGLNVVVVKGAQPNTPVLEVKVELGYDIITKPPLYPIMPRFPPNRGWQTLQGLKSMLLTNPMCTTMHEEQRVKMLSKICNSKTVADLESAASGF